MMKRRGSVDYVILASVILLVLIGFVALASASSDLGARHFGDAYHYLKQQALHGFAVGILGFLVGYFIDYKRFKKFTPILFIITLGILLLTFTPLGVSAGGALRWLQLGPITIQPSELLKLFFIAYLAAWFAGKRGDRQRSITEGFLPFLSISGIVGAILLLQRSASAIVIILSGAFAVYVVGGARKKYIFGLTILGVVALIGIIILTPYRLERVKTLLEPGANILDSGYHLNQALMGIGSGGITGVGYGQSALKNTLPERMGDSIFVIIAEEFGFIGSIVLIGLFLTLTIRILILAKRSRDEFGKLLLIGFGTIIGLQAFIHIGANSGLIPLTGVTLPFISLGGTSLAVFMTMSGIILNISKRI